ncbi:MCE family protein [Gordonia sputi]
MREHSAVRYLVYAAVAIAVVVGLIAMSLASYTGAFQDTTRIYLNAPRAGLMLQPGSDVKMSGVVIGRVSAISVRDGQAHIQMDLDSSTSQRLPDNVVATLDPTTLFGRKFVSLRLPDNASQRRLASGTVIDTSDTPVEVSDTFELLLNVLDRIDPAKVNTTLTALETGTAGRGERFGDLIETVDNYLGEFNRSIPALRNDIRLGADNLETFADLAPDFMTTIKNLTTTSRTVQDKNSQLSAFLLSFTRFGNNGSAFIAPTARPLITAADALAPTTRAIVDYGSTFPCFFSSLNNARKYLENGFGGKRPGLDVLGTLLLGDPPYRPGIDAPRNDAGKAGASCYGYPFAPGDKGPGHIDFDDGSHAYRSVTSLEDVVGNPFASLIYGMTR